MWQVLLAAAVAGSTGLVAKHFFAPALDDPSKAPASAPPDQEAAEPSTPQATECGSSCVGSEGIFRFSSSGSAGARPKGPRKKPGVGPRKLALKEAEVPGGSEDVGAAHRKSGRKFYICLKRRKTGRNTAPKCGSCSSKESSLFNYGLGVGIMCMMSAGKAEIGRLNTSMDETAKVVKELKSELHRRKSSQGSQKMSLAKQLFGGSVKPTRNKHGLFTNKSMEENVEPGDTQMPLLSVVDDGEYASSVLTEEPEREVMEMDQLEAELESELEKLPWSIGDGSCETQPYIAETEVPYTMDHQAGPGVPGSSQFSGVLPSELNQKLTHVLIKQQGSQITDLETELNSTQFKLQEKEAELQALKDCVRRLTEFSISNDPDDEEAEAHEGEEWTDNWGCGSESIGPVIVGTKRPIIDS